MRSIRQLVARDKLGRALEELGTLVEPLDDDLADEVTALRGRLERIRRNRRRNLISDREEGRQRAQVMDAVLSILSAAEKSGPEVEADAPAPAVFISYSHADAAVANKLAQALTSKGVAVRIDAVDMESGEPIADFVQRSIRETAVTLSLVSEDSLLSSWVALETVSTFWEEKSRGNRRFIAGYIDDSFFAPGFRLEATRQIDDRLQELDRLIVDYLRERLDTVDLDAERSRLLNLRHGLGDVLERLKGSLTLDLREPHFDDSVAKILATVRRETR